MESDATSLAFGDVVHVLRVTEPCGILLVCEHASNRIPPSLGDMGLDADARQSHIAWDPGALAMAQELSAKLPATLVYGGASRLVYDCNRPPEAPSAVPVRSERLDIPGNAALTNCDRQVRVQSVYEPFKDTLDAEISKARQRLKLLMTIHSFTPEYMGQAREVEFGILHGTDARFAKAMLDRRPNDFPLETRLNEPYSAADGVTHTLDLHGAGNGVMSVMLEIRNDLIRTKTEQIALADHLVPWITDTLDGLDDI